MRAARRAVTKAMTGGQVEGEDWEAIQQMLGGVVRKPEASKTWGGREAQRRIREIAGAIGEMQDWAWEEISGWSERTKVQRSEYITRDEGARAEEEQARRWRLQRKKGRRQRVLVAGQTADMEAICTFNYARWVPPKVGECGRWEYLSLIHT